MKQLTQYESNYIAGGTAGTSGLPDYSDINANFNAMKFVVIPFILGTVASVIRTAVVAYLGPEKMNNIQENLGVLWSVMNGTFKCCPSSKKHS